MKKRYTINVHYTMIHTVEVEAESEIAAIERAEDLFSQETDFSNDDFDGITESCITDTEDLGDEGK